MKYIFHSLLLVGTLALLSTSSCKKKENEAVAGKGGSAVLKVSPKHHSDYIDSCTIFLKYNAQDKPSSYDEQVVCVQENGKPVATFTGLKKGNYYVYGDGWDPDIEQKVVGGIPYTVSEEKTYDINVPVTEGD
ncbi:MAG: hypothetical protein H6551_00540 [Chitinophagales bacterium]|nr:hypothetical protein [Chitinophagaceae bacterium]MCB9063609.1 hypothetical protein [Chitinophagales bacterium]